MAIPFTQQTTSHVLRESHGWKNLNSMHLLPVRATIESTLKRHFLCDYMVSLSLTFYKSALTRYCQTVLSDVIHYWQGFCCRIQHHHFQTTELDKQTDKDSQITLDPFKSVNASSLNSSLVGQRRQLQQLFHHSNPTSLVWQNKGSYTLEGLDIHPPS